MPGPIEAPLFDRQAGAIRLVCCAIALSVGALHAWSGRHAMNIDGVSYLDLGDALIRGDWSNGINAHWSPLYAAMLGLFMRIGQPSAYWEFTTAHVLNFCIYAAALAAFDLLLREVVRYQRASRSGGDPRIGLPDWAWIGLAYLLFVWSSLQLISLWVISPDLSVAGVVFLAGGREILRHPDRAALLGLFAGTGFGLAPVSIRAATQSLGDSPALVRAIVALAVMNTMQTVIHGGYLAVRERDQIALAFHHWRSSSVVGVLSVCGSACWSWAFALQNAARVRTFGQIELLFTFAVAHWWLHERHSRRELTGASLVLVGVLGVMIAG